MAIQDKRDEVELSEEQVRVRDSSTNVFTNPLLDGDQLYEGTP